MKWVMLLAMIGLAAGLGGWLRTNSRELPKIAMAIGFLPFVISSWHLLSSPIVWYWPGYVKGTEITFLDSIALGVLLSRRRATYRLPFLMPMLCYVGAVTLSIAFANVPEASFFVAWQAARVVLVAIAVTRLCEEPKCPEALISGMAAGLALQAFYAVQERGGGALAAGGTMGHQNLLGMASHLAVFPSLALLLAGSRRWGGKVGPVAGLMVEVLTASRATIGLAGGGFAGLLLLSGLRKWTSRKATMTMSALLLIAIAAPFAMSQLDRRFDTNPLSAYDERAAFERAAKAIIHDYPMGIGANQYVVVANSQGYLARAGVAWSYGSRATNVHNAYLLTWAETGYLGIITLLILMYRPALVAFRCAFRNRHDMRGDIVLGCGVAIVVVGIHCRYEWIFVQFPVQYLLGMNIGLIGGLAQQLGYWGSRRTSTASAQAPRRADRARPADLPSIVRTGPARRSIEAP